MHGDAAGCPARILAVQHGRGGDHAGAAVDGEIAAVIIGQAVGDAGSGIRVHRQRGDVHHGPGGQPFVHRIGHAIRIADRANRIGHAQHGHADAGGIARHPVRDQIEDGDAGGLPGIKADIGPGQIILHRSAARADRYRALARPGKIGGDHRAGARIIAQHQQRTHPAGGDREGIVHRIQRHRGREGDVFEADRFGAGAIGSAGDLIMVQPQQLDGVIRRRAKQHQRIIARAAIGRIHAAAEIDSVAPAAAIDRIIACAAIDEIGAAAAVQRIIARAAIQLVAAGAAVEHIVAAVARDHIVAAIAGDIDIRPRACAVIGQGDADNAGAQRQVQIIAVGRSEDGQILDGDRGILGLPIGIDHDGIASFGQRDRIAIGIGIGEIHHPVDAGHQIEGEGIARRGLHQPQFARRSKRIGARPDIVVGEVIGHETGIGDVRRVLVAQAQQDLRIDPQSEDIARNIRGGGHRRILPGHAINLASQQQRPVDIVIVDRIDPAGVGEGVVGDFPGKARHAQPGAIGDDHAGMEHIAIQPIAGDGGNEAAEIARHGFIIDIDRAVDRDAAGGGHHAVFQHEPALHHFERLVDEGLACTAHPFELQAGDGDIGGGDEEIGPPARLHAGGDGGDDIVDIGDDVACRIHPVDRHALVDQQAQRVAAAVGIVRRIVIGGFEIVARMDMDGIARIRRIDRGLDAHPVIHMQRAIRPFHHGLLVHQRWRALQRDGKGRRFRFGAEIEGELIAAGPMRGVGDGPHLGKGEGHRAQIMADRRRAHFIAAIAMHAVGGILREDLDRFGSAIAAGEGDIAGCPVIEAVGAVQRNRAPIVAAGGNIGEGDIAGVGQRNAHTRRAAAIGGDIGERDAIAAVDVDLRPARSVDGDVFKGDVADPVIDCAGIGVDLDAIAGAGIGGGAVHREIAQAHPVGGDIDAVTARRQRRGIDDDARLALADNADILGDVQLPGKGVGAVGDHDGIAIGRRGDGGLKAGIATAADQQEDIACAIHHAFHPAGLIAIIPGDAPPGLVAGRKRIGIGHGAEGCGSERGGEMRGIHPVAAQQPVCPGPAGQAVIPALAIEKIIAALAFQHIGIGGGGGQVVAIQHIGKAAAQHGVRAIAAQHHRQFIAAKAADRGDIAIQIDIQRGGNVAQIVFIANLREGVVRSGEAIGVHADRKGPGRRVHGVAGGSEGGAAGEVGVHRAAHILQRAAGDGQVDIITAIEPDAPAPGCGGKAAGEAARNQIVGEGDIGAGQHFGGKGAVVHAGRPAGHVRPEHAVADGLGAARPGGGNLYRGIARPAAGGGGIVEEAHAINRDIAAGGDADLAQNGRFAGARGRPACTRRARHTALRAGDGNRHIDHHIFIIQARTNHDGIAIHRRIHRFLNGGKGIDQGYAVVQFHSSGHDSLRGQGFRVCCRNASSAQPRRRAGRWCRGSRCMGRQTALALPTGSARELAGGMAARKAQPADTAIGLAARAAILAALCGSQSGTHHPLDKVHKFPCPERGCAGACYCGASRKKPKLLIR